MSPVPGGCPPGQPGAHTAVPWGPEEREACRAPSEGATSGGLFRRGPVGSIGASLTVRAPRALGLVLSDQEGLVGDVEDAGVSVKAVQSF